MGATEVRTTRLDDIPRVLELQHDCYPVLSKVAQWRDVHLRSHIERFPDGQLVAEAPRRLVGHSASFRTSSQVALKPHSFSEITHRGTFAGHEPEGDTLYGAEIMVHPDYRRRGIARRFYEARFDLMRRLRIRYFVAGGRLPGYADVAQGMPVEDYVQAVVEGRLQDRVLTPQLRAGLRVAQVLPGYLPDPRSQNFATLLVWENPALGRPRPVRARSSKRTAVATRHRG